MNCEAFDHRLDDLLDGRCTADEWREAEAHLAGCPRCRRVFEAVAGRADDMDAAGHESLAQAIVARTSGGGCATARERLCDFVDGSLAGLDRDLVGGHLDHCPACAELATALAETASVLPSFATLSPRFSLVPAVLAATSRRPVQPTLGDRVSAWLARAAERPRFSLEVAYVLTVLLLVVLGNPVHAFKEASDRVQPRVSVVQGRGERTDRSPLRRGRGEADARRAGDRAQGQVGRRRGHRPGDVLAVVADLRRSAGSVVPVARQRVGHRCRGCGVESDARIEQ